MKPIKMVNFEINANQEKMVKLEERLSSRRNIYVPKKNNNIKILEEKYIFCTIQNKFIKRIH